MRRDLTSRTPILTYHDIIARRDGNDEWFDCTVGEFRAQLDWLRARGARFVSLGQMYEHLTRGTPLPPHAILLTFADGYEGFYRRAVPILRQRKIPAVMFVHTSYMGVAVGRPKMTWDQLRELDREGLIAIESETETHPADLRTLDDDALAKEMSGGRARLVKELGRSAWAIAYPNGKWDARSTQAAKRAGYRIGFTEELRPAETATSILAVPRYVHTKYRQAWRDAYGSSP